MARGLLTTTLAAVCAALGVAGCSGSTGTHVQTPGKSTPAPVSSSDPNTTAPPATTSVPRSTTTTTAAGFGAEQPAVDTYIKLVAASNAAFRDPQHVSLTLISSYTAGQAKLEYAQSLTAAKKQGIAYKGTPSTPVSAWSAQASVGRCRRLFSETAAWRRRPTHSLVTTSPPARRCRRRRQRCRRRMRKRSRCSSPIGSHG